MHKKLLFNLFLVLSSLLLNAQNSFEISGKVVDSKTQEPLKGVYVSLVNTLLGVNTSENGEFKILNPPSGRQTILLELKGYISAQYPVNISSGKSINMGFLFIESEINVEQQLSLVTLTENELNDDSSSSESTSGILQSSRDVFQQTAAFNWGQARFRIRGLDSEYGITMINGITMNKFFDGRPQFGNWGGLNDATRLQEFTLGSAASDYTFGGILGTQEINTRASAFRKGNRISFAGANTTYSWRAMGTANSGLLEGGWAYSISASRRWAKEAYFEGTDNNSVALFASIEKFLGANHSLNFTSIYSDNRRGQTSPNTQEVTDLKGFRYNSYWGYQNGRKRNSRDRILEEPIFILSHYWKIGKQATLNTNLSYQTGTSGRTRLDYPNTGNPDPTYYKNLPSYYLNLTASSDNLTPAPNYFLAEKARIDFVNNGQLDWDSLYLANSNSAAANVVLSNQRNDDNQFTANSIFFTPINDHIKLNAGVTYRKLISRNYQEVIDLLGAQYIVNKSTFITDPKDLSTLQYDLNNPDAKISLREAYNYNYKLFANSIDAFGQFKFNYKKFDAYISGNFSKTDYQREGLFRNGFYPNNSFGLSKKVNFDNFGAKGGFTFKLSSQHLFDVNALYMTKAPNLRVVFPNTRVNNVVNPSIKSEIISSVDVSYILRYPKIKARLSAYGSKIENSNTTAFYFAEGILDTGGSEDALSAELVTGISRKNYGTEIGIDYQFTPSFRLTAAGSFGRNLIDNNPTLFNSIDSDLDSDEQNPYNEPKLVYLKNYRQSGSPQTALSLGIEYRSPNFWNIGINANYLDDNYISVSNLLRTEEFTTDGVSNVAYPGATKEIVSKILEQEKFDPIKLVNLIGGKSWRLRSGETFGFFATINNVFDLVYKSGGFEQSRTPEFSGYQLDNRNGTPSFGNRYFYNFGRTYFVNLYINF